MSDKQPVAFCTNISDEYFHSMGAAKLVASATYFHPGIPFFIYGTKEVEALGQPHGSLMPFIMNQLIDEYQLVVRFDADSMIVGELDELLIAATDYEVIGVRNNNDYGKAGIDDPIAQKGAGTDHYLNAGLVATTSKAFLQEWMNLNVMFADMLPFAEQTVLNSLAQKYTTLIVDAPGTEVYYGVSGLYGNGEENQSHWDSWKDIHVVKGDLYLGAKKVKVLHHAGGFSPNKLGFYMFNDQTRKRLVEITGG